MSISRRNFVALLGATALTPLLPVDPALPRAGDTVEIAGRVFSFVNNTNSNLTLSVRVSRDGVNWADAPRAPAVELSRAGWRELLSTGMVGFDEAGYIPRHAWEKL